jgi:PTS system cellobiose-specific IIA component
MDDNTVMTATKVIIHSGNARAAVQKALTAAASGDLAMAQEQLESAEEEIRQAHRTQTEVIQAEARGEPLDFSILLTHAQDTLMTAMSEVHLAQHMLVLYRKLYELTGADFTPPQ